MLDLFIIAFLVIACLALCFICWYQDEQLTQKNGYIGRLESLRDAYHERLVKAEELLAEYQEHHG